MTVTHYCAYFCISAACVNTLSDESPAILSWPQRAHHLLLVQWFYLSSFFNSDLYMAVDTEEDKSGGHGTLNPSVPFPVVS